MTVASLPQRARHVADSDWTARLARAGLCARGVVYAVVGLLALRIAADGRTATAGDASKEGALRAISREPLGKPLLVLLAVGMGGYAFWRASEAIWGKRDEDDEAKRSAKRAGSASKAALYAAFCITTVRFALGGTAETGKGGHQEKAWTAKVLGLTGGRWIVGGVGLAIIVGAAYLAYRGFSQKFEERLDTSEMGRVEGPVVGVLGTVGMAARALVFAVAGYLLVRAAVDFDARKATGLDGTLRVIARQGYGQALLAVTAVGIVAYGLYSLAEARHREL